MTKPATIAALMQGRRGNIAAKRNPEQVYAYFAPGKTLSGVSNIDRVISFAGGDSDVEPTLCVVADGSGGLTSEYGEAMSLTGSGAAPSDNSDAAFGLDGSKSTRYAASGQYHEAQTAAACSPHLQDVFVCAVVRMSSLSAVTRLYGSYANGLHAYTVGGNIYVNLRYGGTIVSNVFSLAGVNDQYMMLCTAIDRSGSMRSWVCGVVKDTDSATSLSSTDIVNSTPYEVGAVGGSATAAAFGVQYLAYYLTDDIGTHDQQDLVDKLYAQWTGQTLAKSKGIYVPTTLAQRTDEAMLRIERDGETLWAQVASNIPTVEYDSNGVAGYWPVVSQTNRIRHNDDLSNAAWTKGMSVGVASTDGPAGLDASCAVSGLGIVGLGDLYQSASGYIANAAIDIGFALRRVASETGTLTVAQVAGSAYGLMTVDLSALTAGEWAWIDARHVAITVTAAFRADASGNFGLRFYSTGGSVDCDIWGVTCVEGSFGLVRRPILTASAARTAGVETGPIYDDAANIPDAYELRADIDAVTAGAAQGIVSIGAAASNSVLSIDAADKLALDVTDASATQAALASPSALSSGRQGAKARVKTDAFSLTAAGQAEQTDTSGDAPSTRTPLYIASDLGSNQLQGGIYGVKVVRR